MSEAKTNLTKSGACWLRTHSATVADKLPPAGESWAMSEVDLSRSQVMCMAERGLVSVDRSSSPNQYSLVQDAQDALEYFLAELGWSMEVDEEQKHITISLR